MDKINPQLKKVAQEVMDKIYEENPKYWPYGLKVSMHDDVYLVRDNRSSKVAGFVGFQKRTENNNEVVGYYSVGILPEYREQGFGKQAVRKLIEEKSPEVSKIKAFIVKGNEPSTRLANSLNISVVSKVASKFDKTENLTAEKCLFIDVKALTQFWGNNLGEKIASVTPIKPINFNNLASGQGAGTGLKANVGNSVHDNPSAIGFTNTITGVDPNKAPQEPVAPVEEPIEEVDPMDEETAIVEREAKNLAAKKKLLKEQKELAELSPSGNSRLPAVLDRVDKLKKTAGIRDVVDNYAAVDPSYFRERFGNILGFIPDASRYVTSGIASSVKDTFDGLGNTIKYLSHDKYEDPHERLKDFYMKESDRQAYMEAAAQGADVSMATSPLMNAVMGVMGGVGLGFTGLGAKTLAKGGLKALKNVGGKGFTGGAKQLYRNVNALRPKTLGGYVPKTMKGFAAYGLATQPVSMAALPLYEKFMGYDPESRSMRYLSPFGERDSWYNKKRDDYLRSQLNEGKSFEQIQEENSRIINPGAQAMMAGADFLPEVLSGTKSLGVLGKYLPGLNLASPLWAPPAMTSTYIYNNGEHMAESFKRVAEQRGLFDKLLNRY